MSSAAPHETATTVLVVDDDDDLLALAAAVLRRAGYEVTAASDGVAARDAARAMGGPDVLFTDIAMPGLDGFALAEALRDEVPGLAIVMTTGLGDERVRRRAADDGHELLPKPYTPDRLLRAVAGAVAAREVGAP